MGKKAQNNENYTLTITGLSYDEAKAIAENEGELMWKQEDGQTIAYPSSEKYPTIISLSETKSKTAPRTQDAEIQKVNPAIEDAIHEKRHMYQHDNCALNLLTSKQAFSAAGVKSGFVTLQEARQHIADKKKFFSQMERK